MRRLLLLALLVLPTAAAAATPPWTVRAQATVNTPVVRLGDLLDGTAAEEAPSAVREMVLSAAPQPGMPLRWTRVELGSRLRSAGLPVADFVLPAEIEVRRAAEAMPESAVLAALSAYLHRPLTADDIRYAAPLTTASDPAVDVLRAAPDAAHQRLTVTCRARNDVRLLPFVVSVRMTAEELHARTQHVFTRPVRQPFLVKPGETAKLVIADPGFAMTTLVEPLQPGRKGDRIRVRSLATKAILHVVVTGQDRVGSLSSGGADGSR